MKNRLINFLRQGERINKENYRFYSALNYIYIIAFVLHVLLLFTFRYFRIPFMVNFNLFISLPTFLTAYFINRRGHHNLAFLIAFMEVTIHQTLGVYFLGFGSGLQYYLIIMPLIAFFNRSWRLSFHLFLTGLIIILLVLLILIIPPEYSRVSAEYSDALKAMKILNSVSTILIVSMIAYHFVQITFKAEKNLHNLNKTLREKNKAILQKNSEIEQQAEVLNRQKKEILSSIHYAQHIQNALLPDESILQQCLSDYFIILRPRNIVSGDFYWLYRNNGRVYVLAADATGHGVPGAFMSIMGLSYLEQIVLQEQSLSASDILEKLRSHVKNSLTNTSRNTFKEGFDLSLLIFDFPTQTYHFAGAYSPVYHYHRNTLHKLEADRQPVGIYPKEKPFSEASLRFEKGDVFYLASDGFSDQLGGPAIRKYTKKRLRKKLAEIAGKDLSQQETILKKELDEWMKTTSQQTDDILLMGIQI